jgi:16S rRNA (guanine966-N2)-methyltransferase
VRSDAVRLLASVNSRFDVVFLDRRFTAAGWNGWHRWCQGVLAADGVIYAEAEKGLEGLGSWRTLRHGRAGQVFYHLMRRGEADGTE